MITKGEVLADQRLKLNNIVTIQNALKKTDNNTIIRRTAFRRLLSLSEGKTLVYQYMNDPDPLIRQAAVYFLHNVHSPKAEEYLIKATEDKKFVVKYLAIILLRSRKSVKIKRY